MFCAALLGFAEITAWKAVALPLSYTRDFKDLAVVSAVRRYEKGARYGAAVA
jgi:hypothetical protein